MILIAHRGNINGSGEYENGQKYLQCKRCLDYIKVDTDAVGVTCSHCVALIQIAKFPDSLPKSSKKKDEVKDGK